MLAGSLATILVAGLLAGTVHVWSGMDHLAALATLSLGKGRHAVATGASWGLGHSAGVVLVALLAVTLKHVMDIDAMSSVAERLVGVVLIGLGVWGIRQALHMRLHVHEHSHHGDTHSHLHTHARGHVAVGHPITHRHTHTAVAIGTLHGFAGAGHFLAVLPAVGLRTFTESCVYLAAFSAGTVAAMAIYAGLIGWSSLRAQLRGGLALARRLMISAASLSIAVGSAWIILPILGWELP